MARHRGFRNMDYDDLSDDEDDYGSLGTSYGSLGEYCRPPPLSYASAIEETPPEDAYRYEDGIPEDYELLSPALDELEPILGDSFDFQQMITALRRFNYETQSAIDWLMTEDEENETTFEFEDFEEREYVHSSASIFASKPKESEDETNSELDIVSNNEIIDKESENIGNSIIKEDVDLKLDKKEEVVELYRPSSLANVLCTSPPNSRMDLCFQVFPSLCISPVLSPPSPTEPELPPGIKPFKFNQPSPDDVVLQTQEKGKQNANNKKQENVDKPKIAEPFKPIIVGEKKNKKNNNNKNSTTEKTKPIPKEEPVQQESIPVPENAPIKKIIIPKPKKSFKQMTPAAREKIMESLTNSGDKDHINLVVVGHVDAGKSTTMGRVLLELGKIDQKTMHKYKKLAAEEGKSSFVYAWILDEQGDERNRGVTIDVGLNYFETESKRITLLDAPGHKAFVPNMITGAAQADSAILMIDSTPGEFETGISDDGQTKEHTLLIRSLGVENLIVAVNKLDNVNYSQERYNFIVDELRKFLKQTGYRTRDVRFVPCSGFQGENITKCTDERLLKWYSGDTLVQAIDHLAKPTRLIESPLRMCVADVYKNIPLGLAIGGKIESGIIGIGDNLLIIPGYEICTVKAIEVHDKPCKFASAGDTVSLGITGIDTNNIGVGQFVCDPQKPIPYTNRFMAKIITFKLRYPLTPGSAVTLQYQNVTVEATIIRLMELLDKATGTVTRSKPRSVGDSVAALVAIKTAEPICIEMFNDNKQLGRFTLREDGQTIATGIVTKLLKRIP